MNREHEHEMKSTPTLEAALQLLVPLLSDSSRLPAPADILRRARLRERELAAERLAQWHSRIRNLALGLLATAAAGAAYATNSQWAGWLLQPLVENLPMPGNADPAVFAGALLAASGVIVWSVQQFVEE